MSEGHDPSKVEKMKRVANRVLTIQFNADTAASMRWNFKPQQYEIKVIASILIEKKNICLTECVAI